MGDRRKRIKKYAFSNEIESVWTGENKTKTLELSKMFCFVFVGLKTDFKKCARGLSSPLGGVECRAISYTTYSFGQIK